MDPRWPKLLSLAVHEFRTPITVVGGYIRMLLKERAGPISDQQRKLLEEAEKSCGRLSALVAEMSDLSALEAGTASMNTAGVELDKIVADAIAALPPVTDQTIAVELRAEAGTPPVKGDATRLRTAIGAILAALRREVVNSDRLIVQLRPGGDGHRDSTVLLVGDPEQLEALTQANPAALERFDEWRGGSGLSLAIARRVISQHGGALYNPPGGGRAGAVMIFPAAPQ